ncbi:hypothetical protein TNCV_825261 [Trichonephila clavipes]|nr:hypothetical protein TNCV_825261 [Trichonephila clavipes]
MSQTQRQGHVPYKGIYCTLVEQQMDYLYLFHHPMPSSSRTLLILGNKRKFANTRSELWDRWRNIDTLLLPSNLDTMGEVWFDVFSRCEIQSSRKLYSFEDALVKCDE